MAPTPATRADALRRAIRHHEERYYQHNDPAIVLLGCNHTSYGRLYTSTKPRPVVRPLPRTIAV